MADELDFSDLKPVQIPVKLPAVYANGSTFMLCEASAGAAKAYRNAATKMAKFTMDGDKPKVTGIGDIGNLEPIVVSECLFRVGGNGELSSVTLPFVEGLPERIVKQLYDRAMEISPALRELPNKVEGNAKN